MLYEVKVAANKGLGLFAKRTIPRGTRIIAEKPLIALHLGQRPSEILSRAKELDVKGRQRLLELSWHPGNGIKRLGRWCEALGWVLRSRRMADQKIMPEVGAIGVGKESAMVPGRLSEAMRDLSESFRILSIFRSNSFNLASSANLSSDVHRSSPSTGSESLPSDALLEETSGSDLGQKQVISSSRPTYELALFPSIARINHSCNPNAQANYHPLHQTFNVHATRDISPGEEVSINYLPEHGQLRDQRVSKLEEGYGFTCNCPACNLNTEEGRQGERSRKEMRYSMKKTRALLTDSMGVTETADAGYGADGMPETLASEVSEAEQQQIDALRKMPEEDRQSWLQSRELEVLNTMLAMYRKEGIVGREVASMHYHIARLQRSVGSYEEAIASVEEGLMLEEDCLGADHPAYLEALALVEGMREEAAGGHSIPIQSA